MSAVAGVLFFHGDALEPGLIEKLTSSMSARGPDSQANWVSGSVGLGHCMLRTTAESLVEQQPLLSQDGNLVLVWDGRIDNRDDLRRTLISHGAVLRDNSDAEMVLHSFAVWGERCPTHLLGDFAFAVWDARRSMLFCFRDYVGARPFYYVCNDRLFAFASEDEALLRLPGVSSQPNEEWIATMFVPAFEKCIDPCQAWLKDVRFLGAGQQLRLTKVGQIDVSTYWKLEPKGDTLQASDADYAEAFFGIFNEAVRCRMRAARDPAVMMSGGLDSASIAAMIDEIDPNRQSSNVKTYSTIFDQPDNSIESRCIKVLTRNYGDKAKFLSVPSMNGIVGLQDLIDFSWSKSRVHPVDNSVLLPAMMCLAAHRDDQRIMLHGASGDLANHSPGRYQAYLLREGLIRIAWRECVEASTNHFILRGENPSLLLLKNIWTAFAPRPLKTIKGQLLHGLNKRFYKDDLIGRRLLDKLRIKERLADLTSHCGNHGLEKHQKLHTSTLFPLGLRIGLEAYERVAGRNGIEMRDPWADKRVLEFMVNLPLQQKVRHGWTKYLVRSALLSKQDSAIRWRNDFEHLGWHLHMQLAAASEQLLTELFADKHNPMYEYVNHRLALFHLKRFKDTRNPESADHCVWLASLALWLQRMADL